MPNFHPIYGALGAAILIVLFVDVVWTTMHRHGGLATRVAVGRLWNVARRTHLRGLVGHRLMSAMGVALVVLTVLLWIGLLWLGWTLVFLSLPEAVQRVSDDAQASVAERIYYVGFTVFTLGVGDYTPGRSVAWQVLTAVASFSGFGLVTFVITYLMPVVQSAVAKRALASRITALGRSPREMVRAASGQGKSGLETAVGSALSDLASTHQQHQAYPVLHFFHHPRTEENVAVAVARLDEALRLEAASRDVTPCSPAVRRQWSTLLDRFLGTMDDTASDEHEPDLPQVAPGKGVDQERLARECARDRRRRQRLGALIHGQGWSWADVDPGLRDE
jgi:uncharacterized membrane protein